jgi:hypothetical protein
MAFLDPVNTITTKEIIPGITDGVFRNSPLLAFARKNCLEPYTGGPSWQENILYDVLNIAAYTPGDAFDTTQSQIATGATVTPRYYNVAVPAYIEKLRIEMNGKRAVFDHVDLLLQAAALSMSAKLSNDLYRDGQAVGRTANINGLDEALNDGTNTGFQGSTFTSYLTLTRTDVGAALISPMTSPTANVAGAISYPVLEQAFQSVTIGMERPDLMITSNNGFSYIKMVFQPQQRFEETDPDFGFQTLKFNGAKVLADQYAPGTRAATAADTKVGYAAVASGETLWYLNTKFMRLYVSTDPLFKFGFTGFLPAQNNSVVVGHYKACLNFTVQTPRLMRYLFGITG